MFCVVQEVKLKQPNRYGIYKKYEISKLNVTIEGKSRSHYSYYPNEEAGRYERPHREAYKISIHESYRINGKTHKRQCVICTINYYQLALNDFVWESMEGGIEKATKRFQWNFEDVATCIEGKTEPLIKRIQDEFQKTEEARAIEEHEQIMKTHEEAKAAFVEKYSCIGVDSYTYECIYDALSNLRDPDYLKEIKDQYNAYCSYSGQSYNNYNRKSQKQYKQSWSSCFDKTHSTYTDDEKIILKKFYKTLSMKYHPDMNPQQDTTKEMQFFNKLKADWYI